MKSLTHVELLVAALGLLLGALGYLLGSPTVEFLAVIDAAFAAALVVARSVPPS